MVLRVFDLKTEREGRLKIKTKPTVKNKTRIKEIYQCFFPFLIIVRTNAGTINEIKLPRDWVKKSSANPKAKTKNEVIFSPGPFSSSRQAKANTDPKASWLPTKLI